MGKFTFITSLILTAAFLGLMGFIGCSGIEPPAPGKLLTHPLGTNPIKLGMTKDEVSGVWGEPDLIQDKGESADKGLTAKEEWVYYGRISNLPINYGNLSKTMRIHFDGDNVVNIKEE